MAAALFTRSRRLVVGGLLAAVLAACAGAPKVDAPSATASERAVLAPAGVLRVGVYRGSPSSYVMDANGQPSGVGYLMGRLFAQQLGVPFEPVIFPKNADVQDAIEHGRVDLVFTNASPARAKVMDFAPSGLDVQKSVLVPAGSPLTTLDSLRGKALRIGVSIGSSTGGELKEVYPDAILQDVPTLQQAATMLKQGGLDGFSTNNAILYELSDQVPGSRVLPGSWGLEHISLAIPLGRLGGRDFVARFNRYMQTGPLQQAVDASRLRGTVPPTP